MSQCLTLYNYSETFNSVNKTNTNEDEHSIQASNFKKCYIPFGEWEARAMFFLTASMVKIFQKILVNDHSAKLRMIKDILDFLETKTDGGNKVSLVYSLLNVNICNKAFLSLLDLHWKTFESLILPPSTVSRYEGNINGLKI